jgi:predicted small lipoprotein YifL
MKRIISSILVCILLLGCAFALASCGGPAEKPEDAKAALEEEGYTVVMSEDGAKYAGLKATVFAYKNDLLEKTNDHVEIYYFNDADAANKAWETVSALYEEEAKKLGLEYGIEGSIIYKGTPDAVDCAN